MALGQSVRSNCGLVEAGPPFLKVKFMLICSLIYRQISNFAIMKPQIAIITGNTLEAIGLESIVRKMMPKADVLLLPSFSALDQSAGFFHFFISSETLLSHAQFFLQRKQQTIVLMHGEETLPLQGFRTFNVQHTPNGAGGASTSAATRAGSARRNAANLAADAARNGGVAPCCIRLTQ